MFPSLVAHALSTHSTQGQRNYYKSRSKHLYTRRLTYTQNTQKNVQAIRVRFIRSFALVSASPKAKPGVLAYSAPLLTSGAAVYSREYHGNFAAPYVAAPYVASPYVASPYVASPYAAAYPYAAYSSPLFLRR
uniref:Uncharacterized protein n=1 Tax=Megaselia scalaris TaxID=36166 RepID=T1GQ25_MEGSC